MIKVKEAFYDKKEGRYRNKGESFSASKERYQELATLLPGYVEEVRVKKEKADG